MQYSVLKVYDMMTITYKDPQSKQCVTYLGVVNGRGQTKVRFVAFMVVIRML